MSISHIPPPSTQSPYFLKKKVIIVNSTLSFTTSPFHPLIDLLSSSFIIKFKDQSSPPLFDCCDVFRPGVAPLSFILIQGSQMDPLLSPSTDLEHLYHKSAPHSTHGHSTLSSVTL